MRFDLLGSVYSCPIGSSVTVSTCERGSLMDDNTGEFGG